MAGMTMLRELPGQQDSDRGILRISLNRISFSESGAARIFSRGKISHGLHMKERFECDMDCVLNFSQPETSKLIVDPFG
jgi:hypothetical protein